jgi:hypothetical protein
MRIRVIGLLTALVIGFSCTAQADFRSYDDAEDFEEAREALAAFAGTYQLVKHVYGNCEGRMYFGQGRSAYSFRTGPYEFPAVNLGRQTVNNYEVRGWVKTSMRGDTIKTESNRYMKASRMRIKEETKAEADDGYVTIEHEKRIRAPRNHSHIRNKCVYVRVSGERDHDGKNPPDQDHGKGKMPDQGDDHDQDQGDDHDQDQGQGKK